MAFSFGNLFANFDFFGEATKAVTIAESLGPLLMKAAADGYAAASAPNPKSIIQVLADIEKLAAIAHRMDLARAEFREALANVQRLSGVLAGEAAGV